LGNRGIRIGACAIIFLGFAILFFPIQQGYGIFTLSFDLSEEELIELYEQEQRGNAEQARDEIFVLLRLQNPYLDTPSNVIVSFEESNEVKSLDRRNENFQLIKDEQLSIAEKKFKEILGGKTISNSINDEPLQKKTIHAFKIDNQIGFMNRNFDDFHNYRLLQISIVEDSRDNNWKENLWSSNPYDINKSIENSPKIKVNEIIQNNLIKREHEVFENLIIEQIFLAENIRNEMLGFRITDVQNPYLNKDIDENLNKNVEESSIKTNTGLVIGWSDPTYVTDKPEFNIIDRNAEGFEMVKAMELEIAQNTLNEMLMLTNSEEDDVEIIILTNENKKPNNYKRDDQGFEFFKNKQIDIAEKKLMEILGQKSIHNSDYLEFEKIIMKYYSNLD